MANLEPQPQSTINYPAPKLSLPVKLAYGAGDFGAGLTSQFLAFFLLSFLIYVAGMNPKVAGSVLAIGKIWDAVNDPLVGMLSDRTKTRWGRRYPWMFLTALPFGLSYFLIWTTPFAADASDTTKLWYYVVITTIFQIFFTTTNLPYTSLTAEMGRNYDEVTELTSFRLAFSVAGGVAILIAAGVISALIPDTQRALRYTVLGIIGGGLSVLSIYWCIFGTFGYTKRQAIAERRSLSAVGGDDDVQESFIDQLKTVASNRPFLFVVAIYLCSWMALQVTAAVLPFYAVSWMNTNESLVALLVQGPAIALMFVCAALSKRIGKKNLYFLGSAIWIPVQAALYFLQPSQVNVLYVLCVVASFGVAVAYVVPWSILPDVIDLDELRSGRRREGTFYSFMTLLQKLGLAAGLYLVGAALDGAGFIEPLLPEDPLPVQPESALQAIRFFMGPVPLLFVVLAAVLVYFYPLTREAHAEIMLKLAERKRLKDEG